MMRAMTENQRDFWNAQAATFDDEADHGLRDPEVRAAWRRLLLSVLPPAPADVADLGCGTGSLSVLLGEAGYRVQGLDLSARMVEAATAKATAAGLSPAFTVGDAADPPYEPGSLDVVLVRHVLWAIPEPAAALGRWFGLLRPGGRLVLIEGRWHTGGGLALNECAELVRPYRMPAEIRHLTDPAYWGGPITDERYLLVA
jgi:SAM-dependent methyltransferase